MASTATHSYIVMRQYASRVEYASYSELTPVWAARLFLGRQLHEAGDSGKTAEMRKLGSKGRERERGLGWAIIAHAA